MTARGIVVAVDGSPSSQLALRWAAREAALRNVVLTIVHVIDIPSWSVLALGGPVAPLQTEPTVGQQAEGQQVLADAIKLVEDDAEAPQLDSELLFGAPVPTLAELARTAQLLVVGRRGQSRLRRVVLGSVSNGLTQHAHCPVAVVQDEDTAAAAPGSSLPVVLGVDGSPASELATATAFDEASRRGVPLVAVHAWSDTGVPQIGSREWSAEQVQADEVLAERLAGWQERYPDVEVHRRLVWNHPARHLLEEAEAAQLVVVGSRGRGGFTGLLLGSVSTAVLQASPVPVIVARNDHAG